MWEIAWGERRWEGACWKRRQGGRGGSSGKELGERVPLGRSKILEARSCNILLHICPNVQPKKNMHIYLRQTRIRLISVSETIGISMAKAMAPTIRIRLVFASETMGISMRNYQN